MFYIEGEIFYLFLICSKFYIFCQHYVSMMEVPIMPNANRIVSSLIGADHSYLAWIISLLNIS